MYDAQLGVYIVLGIPHPDIKYPEDVETIYDVALLVRQILGL